MNFGSGGATRATVSCGTGELLLSGGYDITSGGPAITGSYPSRQDGTAPVGSAAPTSWTVVAVGGVEDGVDAYAVCAKAANIVQTRVQAASQPFTGQAQAGVVCPEGTRVSGVGFQAIVDLSQFFVPTVTGLLDDNLLWTVSAQAGSRSISVHRFTALAPSVRATPGPDGQTLSAYAVCVNQDAAETAVNAAPDLVLPSFQCDQPLCVQLVDGSSDLGCPSGQIVDAVWHAADHPVPAGVNLLVTAPEAEGDVGSFSQWRIHAQYSSGPSGLNLPVVTICLTAKTIPVSFVVTPGRPGRAAKLRAGGMSCWDATSDPSDLIVTYQAASAGPVSTDVTRLPAPGDGFEVAIPVPVDPPVVWPATSRTDAVSVHCRSDQPGRVSWSQPLTVPGPAWALTPNPQNVTPGRSVTLNGQGIECPAAGSGSAVEVLFDSQAVPVPPDEKLPASAYDDFALTVTVPKTVSTDTAGVSVRIRCVGQDATPGLTAKVYARPPDVGLDVLAPLPTVPGQKVTVGVRGVDCSGYADARLDLLWDGQAWQSLTGVDDRYRADPYLFQGQVPTGQPMKPGAHTLTVRCHGDDKTSVDQYPAPATLVLPQPPRIFTVTVVRDDKINLRVSGMDCAGADGHPGDLAFTWTDTNNPVVQPVQTFDAYHFVDEDATVDRALPPGPHSIGAHCVAGTAAYPPVSQTVTIPGLTVDPHDAAPEGGFTIRGTYFACATNSTAARVIVTVAGSAPLVAVVDPHGAFAIPLQVPRNANPGPSEIAAKCETRGLAPRSVSLTIDRPALTLGTTSARPGADVTVTAVHFPYSCDSFQAQFGSRPLTVQDEQLSGDQQSGRTVTGRITVPADATPGGITVRMICPDPAQPVIVETAFTVSSGGLPLWIYLVAALVPVVAGLVAWRAFRKPPRHPPEPRLRVQVKIGPPRVVRVTKGR